MFVQRSFAEHNDVTLPGTHFGQGIIALRSLAVTKRPGRKWLHVVNIPQSVSSTLT
jgi:hypothetical protein